MGIRTLYFWMSDPQGNIARVTLDNAILVPTAKPPLTRTDVTVLESQLRRLFWDKTTSTPVVIYCKLGKRAGLAKTILTKMGFYRVAIFGLENFETTFKKPL